MGSPYEPPAGFTFDPTPVKNHNGSYVYPGRLALAGAWPHRPETCDNDSIRGVWVVADPDAPAGWRQVPNGSLEGQLLICPTCGLDCT